ELDRMFHHALVQHWQCTGMAQSDHADVGVRVIAVGVGIAAVGLAFRDQLGMHFEPDHEFVFLRPMAHLSPIFIMRCVVVRSPASMWMKYRPSLDPPRSTSMGTCTDPICCTVLPAASKIRIVIGPSMEASD